MFNDKKNLKEFSDRLKIIDLKPLIKKHALPIFGVGNAIAFSKFIALNKRIMSGSYMLINAHNKKLKDPFGTNIKDPVWFRAMCLEFAFEAYTKVNDYIYQILYYNFELYKILDKRQILKNTDVVELSKTINYDKKRLIRKLLKSKGESVNNFIKLLKSYQKYIYKYNITEIANDFKHRGAYSIRGTNIPRIKFEVKNQNIDINDILSESIIEMDIEIEKLVILHQETIKIVNELYNLCFRYSVNFNKS